MTFLPSKSVMMSTVASAACILHCVVSVTCIIHCMATPFIIAFSPFLGEVFQNSWLEVGLLTVSVFTGISIMYRGYCRHKKRHAMVLFGLGVFMWVLHSFLKGLGIIEAHYYLFIGTAVVLGSYYLNHHHLNCCPAECCNQI